jgi:hypothetical protein
MRNQIARSFIGFMVCCTVIALASPSFGQWWRGDNRYRGSVDRIIRQAENRSDIFVRVLDRTSDDGGLQGFRADRLSDRARDLEQQLNVIRQEFDQTNNHFQIRSQVHEALNIASGINNVMQNRRMSYQAERQWMLLRSDLNRLASIYNLPRLG